MLRLRITSAVLICLCQLALRSSAQESDPEVAGKKVSEWKTILTAAPDEERGQHVMKLLNSRPLPLELMPVCFELLPAGPRDFPYSRRFVPSLMVCICEDAPKAAELLFAELEKGSEDRRIALLRGVRGLRHADLPVVPKLLDFATNEKETLELRCCALDALQKIPSDAAVTLPRLKPLLSVQDKELCTKAVQAIGAMGPAAKSAVTDLMTLLQDTAKDPYLRAEAAMALGHIGHEAKDAIPAMIAFLREVDTPLPAAQALGLMGADAAPAVPVLMMKLHDRNSVMIDAAAHALGNIGMAARPAVPELIRVIKEAERLDDRRSLTGAIGNLCADAQEALPLLVDLMAKDNWGASNPSPTEQALMKIAASAWWEGTMERTEIEKEISSVRNFLKGGNYAYELKHPPGVNATAELCLARALPRFAIRLGVTDNVMSLLLDAADAHADDEVRANAKVAREEWKTKKLLPLPPAKPLAALSAPPPEAHKEPQYGGHTLAEWIGALNDERTKSEAEMALPHCGPDGVRALLHRDHGGATAGVDLSRLSEAELTAIAPVLIEAMTTRMCWCAARPPRGSSSFPRKHAKRQSLHSSKR